MTFTEVMQRYPVGSWWMRIHTRKYASPSDMVSAKITEFIKIIDYNVLSNGEFSYHYRCYNTKGVHVAVGHSWISLLVKLKPIADEYVETVAMLILSELG